MVTLKQVEHFHRNKNKIPKIVLSQTEPHEIIYGARALNKQLPSWLDKPTMDFDIFSATPKVDAMETEKALDKEFGGDFFFVEPALQLKSHVNKEGYADYTKPDTKIPHRKIGKHKYVKLDYVKQHIKKTLKDKEAAYRHDKDRDALNRIKVYETLRKGKKSSKRVRNKSMVGFRMTLNKLSKLLMTDNIINIKGSCYESIIIENCGLGRS